MSSPTSSESDDPVGISPTSSESDDPVRISPLFPGGILEKAGIKHCIVGSAMVRLFGSDLLIADLDIAVADEEFDLALSLLHNSGFHDIDFDYSQLFLMPALDKPGGWVARRLQYPPSSDIVVLSPASCWRLEISPDTTFLPHTDPHRFPHFLIYLEALIRIIDALERIGDRVILFRYQYAIMATLTEKQPELGEMISPGDRFFMDFYLIQYKRPGALKVLELRRQIMEGTISVEAAREVVPRPDLARKRIKEKYLRMRMERENGKREASMA